MNIIINHYDKLTTQDDIIFRINTDLNLALLDAEYNLSKTIEELDYSKKIKDSNKIASLETDKTNYELTAQYIKSIINKEF